MGRDLSEAGGVYTQLRVIRPPANDSFQGTAPPANDKERGLQSPSRKFLEKGAETSSA